MSTPFVVSTTVLIPVDKITNMLVSAIETPLGNWMGWVDAPTYVASDPSRPWWYADEAFVGDPEKLSFEVSYDGPNDDGGECAYMSKKTCTYADIVNGLAKMAVGNPYQFGQMMADDGDAVTAYVFMQYVVLGEEIYG